MNTDPLRLLAAMALGLAWVGWTARVWWRNRAVQPDAMEERAGCLLYTSPSPRDVEESRMPSSA